MRYLRIALVLASIGVVALATGEGMAKKKDTFLIEKYDSYQVQTIGVMAWQMRRYDENAEKIMGRELGQALGPVKYNYKSVSGLRTLARNVGADSLLAVLEGQWHSESVMDSATLKAFGKRVSVDALLASFIDVWEREIIDYSIRGNSFTEIEVKHALYSTVTGELLWSTRIKKEGEGPYNDPSVANISGVNRTGIQTQVRTTTALDPPEYEEVAKEVGAELRKQFPPPPKIETPKTDPEQTSTDETSEDSK
jgi:hypothetical protein